MGEYGFPDSTVAKCPPGKSAELMAQINDLAATWKPTGYYTWQEMADLTAAFAALSQQASTLAIKTFEGGESAALRKAADEYGNKSSYILYYVDAWKKAQPTNTLISAPGFKDWALEMLRSAQKMMRIAEIQACSRPWWAGAALSYVNASYAVIGVAKSIGGAVASAGQAVVDAGKLVVGFWPVLKWVGLGVGVLFAGVFTYNKFNSALDRTAAAGRRSLWTSVRNRFMNAGKTPPVAGRRYLR